MPLSRMLRCCLSLSGLLLSQPGAAEPHRSAPVELTLRLAARGSATRHEQYGGVGLRVGWDSPAPRPENGDGPAAATQSRFAQEQSLAAESADPSRRAWARVESEPELDGSAPRLRSPEPRSPQFDGVSSAGSATGYDRLRSDVPPSGAGGSALGLKALPTMAQDLLRVALRVHGRGGRSRRLQSLRRRTRLSAALPQLRVGVGTSSDQSRRLTPTLSDPGRFTEGGSRDLWFEARAAWRLDRLVYHRDELGAERLRAQAEQSRERLVARVLDELEAWMRARLEASSPLLLEEQRALLGLRRARAQAWLDWWTDGWFSNYLSRRSRRRGDVVGPANIRTGAGRDAPLDRP